MTAHTIIKLLLNFKKKEIRGEEEDDKDDALDFVAIDDHHRNEYECRN